MEKPFRRIVSVLVLPILLSLASACGDGGSSRARDEDALLDADPRVALADIQRIDDRLERAERLLPFLRALPADQMGVIKEVMRDDDVPFRGYERVLMISAWARVDPPAAMDMAMNWERPSEAREDEILEAVKAWARQDPQTLVDEYDLPSGLTQDIKRAVPEAVKGWFESGQPGLEDYVRDLASGARGRAVTALARARVARDGVDATREWAENVEGSESFKADVYSAVAGEMALVDPAQAVEWCDAVCDTDIGKSMFHMIALKWAGHAGADAMDWILTKPSTVDTRTAIRAAYRTFLLSDALAAFDWMESSTTDEQRKGSLLQGPVGMYLRQRVYTDPLLAFEWTQYLQDEGERELARITLARIWLRRDREAAEAWLSKTDLLSKKEIEEAHHPPRRRQRGK